MMSFCVGGSRNINIEIIILWNVAPCSQVDFHRRFRGFIRRLLLAVEFLVHLLEPVGSSETSTNLCLTTRPHVHKGVLPLYILFVPVKADARILRLRHEMLSGIILGFSLHQ
jgi:hypothetical protein